MPIRIKRDKMPHEPQMADSERNIASLIAATTAGYADRKPKFRILCGSKVKKLRVRLSKS